jgi:Arc/MetJ-type ribon-helix-helix transcriptional regulator
MKKKISITINQEILDEMEKQVSEGTYRNMSHALEFAASKLIKEKIEA